MDITFFYFFYYCHFTVYPFFGLMLNLSLFFFLQNDFIQHENGTFSIFFPFSNNYNNKAIIKSIYFNSKSVRFRVIFMIVSVQVKAQVQWLEF